MIYLASPYSHPHAGTRHLRFIAACRAAAYLMEQGLTVFCPIAHSHPIAEAMNGRHMDHQFWMRQDLPLLSLASKMIVLRLPGWEQSRGVSVEMEFAKSNGIPIDYMEAIRPPGAS